MGLMDSYRLNSIMGGKRLGPYKGNFSTPDAPETPIGPKGVSFQQPAIQIPTDDEDDSSRYYRMIQDIRNEQTPGMTAYKTALQNRPQEEEYKPNAWTRTASALSGFSAGLKDAGKGITTAMGLNREPYRRAMEEYQGELSGLEEQAGMEQDERESRMEAIRDASRMGLEHQKFLQQGQHNRALEGTAAENARANIMRAEASARPTYSLQATQGGFLAVNSKDPSDTKVIAAKTPQDAQLEVSRMNAQTSRMQANTSAGQLQRGLNQDQVNNYYRDADLSIRSRTADANANKPPTPASQTSARELALDKLMMHPKWSKFVGTKDEPKGPNDFTPEQWNTFQETLRALEEEILAGGGE
jgi:hypothetical protein